MTLTTANEARAVSWTPWLGFPFPLRKLWFPNTGAGERGHDGSSSNWDDEGRLRLG